MKTMILGLACMAVLVGSGLFTATKMVSGVFGQLDRLSTFQAGVIEWAKNEQTCSMVGQPQSLGSAGKMPKCGAPLAVPMPGKALEL